MPGTPNPIKEITGLTTLADVSKEDFVAWGLARVPQVMVNAAEINASDLSGQLVIKLKSNGRDYILDTSDTTTPDDGVNCIRDFNGLAFIVDSDLNRIYLEDYGGGADVSDNTMAIDAVLAALETNSGCIVFPAGTITILSTITKTLAAGQALFIEGAGPDVTNLYFPNTGNGFDITYTYTYPAWAGSSVFSARDLTFVSGSVNTTGRAINVSGASVGGDSNRPTLIQNVGIRGDSAANHWGFGTYFTDTQNVSLDHYYFIGGTNAWIGESFVGTAITYTGTTSGTIPTVLVVNDLNMSFGNIGIDINGYVEGLAVTGSNITNVDKGIVASAATAGRPQLSVQNTQINARTWGIHSVNFGYGQIVGNTIFNGARSAATSDPAIYIDNIGLTISSNSLVSLGGTTPIGIQLASGATYNVVGNNTFNGFGTNVVLDAGANNNKLTPNTNISGTAMTNAGTGNSTGLALGTSGGIPYYSSTDNILSSALLGTNNIMIGGGAGAAPSTVSNWTLSSTILAGTTSSSFTPQIHLTNTTADVSAPIYTTIKNRGGGPITAGDSLGYYEFQGFDSDSVGRTGARIYVESTAVASGNISAFMAFYTANAGAVAEGCRVQPSGGLSVGAATDPGSGGFLFNAQLYGPNIATTASAANAFIDTTTTPAGKLKRSTSSIIYKRDDEDIEESFADNILKLRPVWYRSKCPGDRKDWSWYGLIAEEVAQIEPRLVHYGYQEDDFETIDNLVVEYHDGELIEVNRPIQKLKAGATIKPDAVQYDRLPVLMLSILQRQEQRLKAVEARLVA